MPTDTENVRLSGKTGRDWRTAKTALLTPQQTFIAPSILLI